MIIGTTKELKNHEYRVGLTPDNILSFVMHGHQVYVETRAGEGAGFSDDAYRAAGAVVLDNAAEVFEKCDMIVKVKEPEPCEYPLLREGQILFTYLHLAPNPQLADELIKRGVKAVAYETITDKEGTIIGFEDPQESRSDADRAARRAKVITAAAVGVVGLTSAAFVYLKLRRRP